MSSKIISAEEAITKIKDNDTVAIGSSGGGLLEPTLLLKTLITHKLSLNEWEKAFKVITEEEAIKVLLRPI